MVQKIANENYLKRIDNMTFAEREDYLRRVGEWLKNKARLIEPKAYDQTAMFQNVQQISATWNDDELQAWNEGAVLLTALMSVSETWLPDTLFTKAAKRTILQMIGCLRGAMKLRETGRQGVKGQSRGQVPGSATTETSPHDMPVPMLPQYPTPNPSPDRGGEFQPITHVKPMVVRPKHIDQYAHLLPVKTQERAAQYGPLMREMEAAREKLRLLVNDQHSSAKDREAWAKRIAAIDKQAKSILKELDKEWDILVQKGGVVVDDLGNVSVLKINDKGQMTNDKRDARKPGRPPMTEEQKAARAEAKAAEKRAEDKRKAALLRKWLIDRRNAKTEEQKEKWLKKFQEMVRLGGEEAVTDKVCEAAEYYGVEIPKTE